MTCGYAAKEYPMTWGILLLAALVLILINRIPITEAAPGRAYADSGHLGPMVLVVVLLLLTGLL